MENPNDKHHVIYEEGYRKGLMDFANWLHSAKASFKSDRKRNNVQNIIWLLDCILSDLGKFMRFGTETTIHFRYEGKNTVYFIQSETEYDKCQKERRKKDESNRHR